MTVVIINKSSFDTKQYNNVSNIAYSAGSVTITSGGTTYTYSMDAYAISILLM